MKAESTCLKVDPVGADDTKWSETKRWSTELFVEVINTTEPWLALQK